MTTGSEVRAIAESGPSRIGLITLDPKPAGARSAGDPHAACDEAGAGNGVTDDPNRARRGKPGDRQGRSYGPPRQSSTLPAGQIWQMVPADTGGLVGKNNIPEPFSPTTTGRPTAVGQAVGFKLTIKGDKFNPSTLATLLQGPG